MTDRLTLDAASIDAIADAVVARLADTRTSDGALIDAAEVARRHGTSRAFVYDNAGRLGAIRLGSGSRARLRFDPATVAATLSQPAPEPTLHTPRHRTSQPTVPLLPIRNAA